MIDGRMYSPERIRGSKMVIYGIDPGPNESALVGIRTEPFEIVKKLYAENAEIESFLENNFTEFIRGHTDDNYLAIEFVQSYGMIIGQSTILTIRAVGRFEKAFGQESGTFLYARPTIRSHIGVVKKQSIIAPLTTRFGGQRKGQPLQGISNHLWDGLGVAVVHMDVLRFGIKDYAMSKTYVKPEKKKGKKKGKKNG